MPPDDNRQEDTCRPTLSLTRLATRRGASKAATVKTESSNNSAKKRPKRKRKQSSAPIPSFHAERERLAHLFDSDSSADEKPTKSKRRSKIPIPSFSTTTMVDSSDDDDDLRILLGDKPVFATKTSATDEHSPASNQNQQSPSSAVESPDPDSLKEIKSILSNLDTPYTLGEQELSNGGFYIYKIEQGSEQQIAR